jgi:hypothetical protein
MTSRTAKMAMKPNQAAKCVEALRALYAPALSPEEMTDYNSLRAAEMARAEARRTSDVVPQLNLEDTP